MLSYLDTKTVLFTRGVTFTLKQYLFVAQVVLGEDAATAYAMVYDETNFVKHINTDDEQEYLATHIKKADVMLQQQECQHLKDFLNDAYHSDIQAKATDLKDFKFSGSDVQQLLANLLHNRVGSGDSLDDASVKDVISLIKTMYEQGALDSGDTFQKHFIQIHEPFNAVCTSCNHEIDAYKGVDCRCPHCGQIYKWSETENRFFPNVSKL